MTVRNIIPQKHSITKQERQSLLGNKSTVVWFTGLSGSGKSTLANLLEKKLAADGVLTYIIDGDNLRQGLNSDLGFSDEDRKENIRRAGELAKLFVDAGVVAITAFISPFREDRDFVRNLLDKNEFTEVYIKCPLEICEKRDVKGLYEKARRGEISKFTGIDSDYEEPLSPELVIDTSIEDAEESAEKIYRFVRERIKV